MGERQSLPRYDVITNRHTVFPRLFRVPLSTVTFSKFTQDFPFYAYNCNGMCLALIAIPIMKPVRVNDVTSRGETSNAFSPGVTSRSVSRNTISRAFSLARLGENRERNI